MNPIASFLETVPGTVVDLPSAALALLLAYLLSQVFAWVYMFTHRGVSYSQSFVQSLVMLALVVCLVMLTVGTNIVIAFGLFGALAIIRFRNILKDTRDTAFLFMMIAVGMTTGTGNYLLAVLGTGVFIAVVVLFHAGNFGARHRFDGLLSFQISGAVGLPDWLDLLLRRHALQRRLVSERTDAQRTAYTWRLLMRDPERAAELVDELKQADGVSGVSLLIQEDESEI